MNRLQSVQSLRFVAALGVILCHGVDGAGLGAGGVDLFFVISGFIITRVAPGKSPGRFLAARGLRIYPMYLLCLIPWLAVLGSEGLLEPDRLVASVTLWPVYGQFLPPYLKPGWSLSFEMLFYLAAALVLWRPTLVWLLVGGFGCTLVAGWLSPAPPLFDFIGSPIIIEFLFGVVVARAPKRFGALSLTLGIAGLCLAWPLGHRLLGIGPALDPWRVLYCGLPWALVLYGAVQFEPLARNWRVLPYLGDASYSLYLIHMLVMALVPEHPLWRVSIALVAGVILYRYAEQPLTHWLRRTLTPSEGPDVAEARTRA